jgi:hypothetical protein
MGGNWKNQLPPSLFPSSDYNIGTGKSVDVELKYKNGWTDAQKAEADAKVKALTEANTVKNSSSTKWHFCLLPL